MNSSKPFRAGGAFIAAGVITLGGVFATGCGGGDTATTPTAAATTALPASPTLPPATAAAANPVVKVGNLEISNIRARATVTDTTAVYLTIKNNGAADTLLSAAVDPAVAAMAQVHEVVASGGTMVMQEMKAGLPIPANGTVELKSGGYHVMVMNVKKPVAAGDIVPITLVFEKAGSVAIKAPGQDDTSAGGMGGASASPTMAH